MGIEALRSNSFDGQPRKVYCWRTYCETCETEFTVRQTQHGITMPIMVCPYDRTRLDDWCSVGRFVPYVETDDDEPYVSPVSGQLEH